MSYMSALATAGITVEEMANFLKESEGCQCHSPVTEKRGDGVFFCRRCGKDWPGMSFDLAVTILSNKRHTGEGGKNESTEASR